MNKKIVLSLLSGLLLTTTLSAEEVKTETNLSYMQSKGNSDIMNTSVDFKGEKKIEKNIYKTNINWYYSEENSVETKNKLTVNITYEYELNKKINLNYMAQYEDDKFSSFNYKFFTGPGVIYKAVKNQIQELKLGVSLLYEKDKPNTGKSIDYMAVMGTEEYKYKITKTVHCAQDFSIRTEVENTDNYNATANFGITNKFNKYFSASVKYKIDYTNKVLPGIKNTDRVFTAGLTINY